MSRTRRAWIITEAAVVLIGAFIMLSPLFTSCPLAVAIPAGAFPVVIGTIGFGLWTFGGKGL